MANKTDATIHVSHITIRQSISVLLLRLIVLDVIAAFFVTVFFWIVSSSNVADSVRLMLVANNTVYFILLAVAKILLIIFVVFQWLNEFYEIFPDKLIYKRGLIWRKEIHYSFDEIVSMNIDQGIIGKIFNYGTITLYDYRERKLAFLYLIHNPMKYYKVLESLLPGMDKEKSLIREHVIEEDEA